MALEPPPTQATSVSGSRPFGLLHLRARLVADDALEVAHHGGIGVRAGHRADDVDRCPRHWRPSRAAPRSSRPSSVAVPECTGRTSAPSSFMRKHVGLLPLDVGGAHVDDAGHVEEGADRGGGDAVLAGAGLGDDAALAHAPRQQDLAHASC